MFQYKIWRTLEKDPLFAHNLVTPVVEDQKRLTQLQLKRINAYKFLTDEMVKSTYSKRVCTQDICSMRPVAIRFVSENTQILKTLTDFG